MSPLRPRFPSVFHGMEEKTVLGLTNVLNLIDVAPGEPIFGEDEEAYGLFLIRRGEVEIYREREGEGKAVSIARLGTGEVFGEMGLIAPSGKRTASARATKPTRVLGVPGEPEEIFKNLENRDDAIQLLQNLVCVMGERLRKANEHALAGDGPGYFINEISGAGPEVALDVIKNSLPKKGLLKRFTPTKKLEKDGHLCEQHAAADGFYFLHSGTLEVYQTGPEGEAQTLAIVQAPNIVGEVGFFADQPRSASVRAQTEVVYTRFAGAEFEKLKRKEPEKALDTLFAAAQLVVRLIVELQTEL